MKTRLLDAKALAESDANPAPSPAAIKARYAQILQQALAEMPPDPPPRRTKRPAHSKARRLLEAFRSRQPEILRFLHDRRGPFDNNLAERDIRMIKLKQKISGCFRTLRGGRIFCRWRNLYFHRSKTGPQPLARHP